MVCTMGGILDLALIVMLSCFMPFHCRMVCLNETTIEGPSPEFDAGMKRNWRQVMGKERWMWLLPIWGSGPDGDGVHWPSPLVKWAEMVEGGPPDAGPPPQPLRSPGGGGGRIASEIEEGRLLGATQSDTSDGE